ncbi:MAG TPA: RDD family protein [Polyangia bacterium]|nr:RDD family protein [Polyangia bacterium]
MASTPPPPPGGPPQPPGAYPPHAPPPGYAPQYPYAGAPQWPPPQQYAAPGPAPGLRYAGFWIRFASYLIDVIPIAIVAGILNVSFGTGYSCRFGSDTGYRCGGGTGFVGSWLGFLVVGVYWVLTWSLLGASLGQKALGMRVVNAQNGERIDLAKALVRYVGFVISAIPFALGLIWAGFDPRKQGWHDKIAGTYVVRQST